MDKLKFAKEAFKKYHFWVLCVVVLAMAMTAWGYAANDQDKRFEDRKRELDSAFDKVGSVSRRPDHPNPKLIDAVKQQTQDLKKTVFEAWKILYEDQQNKNKLPENLSEGFKKAFMALGEGEKDKLEREHLWEYQGFVPKYVNELETSIDRRKPDEERTDGTGGDEVGAGRPGGAVGAVEANVAARGGPAREGADQDEQEEETGKVIWENPEIRKISDNWGGRTPTTAEVRLAQEDFWVYEALIRIINKVNETATSHSGAGVKQIFALQIGKDAAGAWSDPGASVVLAPTAGDGGSPTSSSPIEARYVDDEGEALGGSESSPYAEFNMMPICMRLMIDQKKLSKLLAECANSSMPIEVRRVRLCPGEGSPPLDLTHLAAEEKAASGPAHAAFASRTPGRHGRAASGSSASVARTSPMDISIEILGIIYIYNPPDRDKLGTGAGGKAEGGRGKGEEKPAQPPRVESEEEQPTTKPDERPVEKPAQRPVKPPGANQ